jgi:homoserine kinase type II
MAFYTAVDESDLLILLERYGIGPLSSCTGVSDGIENTTYILRADAGQVGEQQWILTIFEDLSAAELPFFARLMTWLHERTLPVACPLADSSGRVLQHLAGKPALLFPRLPGQHPRSITSAHCAAIGDFLGQMHAASAQYPEQRDNPRGTAWMELAGERLDTLLSEADNALLQGQIANALNLRSLQLPCGLIHGDLFHDNALFLEDKLSGVIDFYNACTDILALDLAIVINDWCAMAEGGVDCVRMGILLDAYQIHRPLTALERQHWQSIMQLAASRFWLSRLLAEKLPARPDSAHPNKPSSEYRNRLRYHLQ